MDRPKKREDCDYNLVINLNNHVGNQDRYIDYLESKVENLHISGVNKSYNALIPDLDTIQNEMDKNIETYGRMKETGNSQGEHKGFYHGKWEAYRRCKVLIDRFMRWHGMKEQECGG